MAAVKLLNQAVALKEQHKAAHGKCHETDSFGEAVTAAEVAAEAAKKEATLAARVTSLATKVAAKSAREVDAAKLAGQLKAASLSRSSRSQTRAKKGQVLHIDSRLIPRNGRVLELAHVTSLCGW